MIGDGVSVLFYFLLFAVLYAQVFLLITLFGMRERKQRGNGTAGIASRRESEFPSVTVIVPCFNEEKTVAATLRSLFSLEYPAEKLRILVVDDGSADGTVGAVRPFLRDPRVGLLERGENGGKYVALNDGLRLINTELVACLDADSFAAPDALRRLAEAFQSSNVMAATSTILAHRPRTILERVQAAEYVVSSLLRHILGGLNALFVTPGPLSVYRREVFEKIGGFSKGNQTEDLEMALRMQANHMWIVHVPAAYVETVVPNKFSGLLRQRTRWHYGFLANVRDYRRLMFRPSYGHVGLIAIPAAVISIGASLAFAADAVLTALHRIGSAVIEISVVGIRLAMPTIHWFFIPSEPMQLLLLVTFVLFGIVVVAAMELFRVRRTSLANIVWFFACYGLIAPIWYARAVTRLLFAREVRWK